MPFLKALGTNTEVNLFLVCLFPRKASTNTVIRHEIVFKCQLLIPELKTRVELSWDVSVVFRGPPAHLPS